MTHKKRQIAKIMLGVTIFILTVCYQAVIPGSQMIEGVIGGIIAGHLIAMGFIEL